VLKMDTQGLQEEVRRALARRGRGSSRSTAYNEVKKTSARYPGATHEQAWLLLAHELDIPIANYEHDNKQLADVGELRRRWSARGIPISPAPRSESNTPARGETERLPREEFPFVSDPKLREICCRDYLELGKGRRARAYKSTIILSGGLLEAVLSDALGREAAKAKASYRKLYPKKKRVGWTLESLIEVAEDLGIITPGATQLSHTLRDYRNLVHPDKEIRSGYKVQKEEAEIAVNMVRIVMRDLKTL
jgi:hypothetical protein